MFYSAQGYYKKKNIEKFSETSSMSPSRPQYEMDGISPKSDTSANSPQSAVSVTSPQSAVSVTSPKSNTRVTKKKDSCDKLIKQSYADFDKKYDLLKNDYENKLKEQKTITQNAMKQFLDEKESWGKAYQINKNKYEKSVEAEKKKLDDLKKMFQQRINSLDSSIREINLSIKNL